MRSRLLRAAGMLLAVSLLACSDRVPRIGPSAQLWDRNAVVGIGLAPLPVAQTYRKGTEGIYLPINAANTSDLEAHLRALDLRAFAEVAQTMATKLQSRGLQVRILPYVVDPERFRAVDSSGGHQAERDYSALNAQAGIDRLLLLRLVKAGTSRNYLYFAPTSAPRGYARVTGQMVELRSGALLWSAASERLQDVTDEWDQPPAFPNVDRAVADAIRRAGLDLVEDLVF